MAKLLQIPVMALLLATAACFSVPDEISTELTPAELIQRAQEASDHNRYKVSFRYYETVLERFPTNMEYVCAAEYEIAFIYYKQKKYNESKAEFASLLKRYDTPDAELLPPKYRILSEKIMATISEIEAKRNRTGD
ncbi:MAG: tetratricopeptide repeat protein [Treponema sp.]|nr:tetratricopeptide repeat protein [Treponema sp.]